MKNTFIYYYKKIKSHFEKKYAVKNLDFLPAVLEVQETPPAPLGRIILWTIIVLVILSLFWAANSQVDIVAVTRGKLTVNQLSRPVHSAITAQITRVYVKEGERVKKGQLLIQLNNHVLLEQQQENLQRQRINELQITRLNALNKLYNGDNSELIITSKLSKTEPLLSQQVKSQYESEKNAYEQEISLHENHLIKLQSQLEWFTAQSDIASGVLPIYRKQYQAQQELFKSNATSENSLLELHKKLVEAEYSAKSSQAKVQEAKLNIEQHKIEFDSRMAEKKQRIENELSERIAENILLNKQFRQIIAQLASYKLIAPVDGKVEWLAYRDAGAAVEASKEVLKIVPEEEKLNAEVWVQNQDVGFLYVGQPVVIKIDAFDFTRYGWIDGELIHLSSDAIDDPKLGLTYKAIISLHNDRLLIHGEEKRLDSGMSVTAEIKTGDRTILSYLLSPMLEALSDVGKQR